MEVTLKYTPTTKRITETSNLLFPVAMFRMQIHCIAYTSAVIKQLSSVY